MAEAFMAYPDLRHPFDATPIHPDGAVSVLYQGKLTTLAGTEGDGLPVSAAELKDITGFELKPEGACYGDMCIPLSDKQLIEIDGEQRVDLAAFADLLGQPYVVDHETGVWSFAEAPAKREGMMNDAMAPDFEVTDREGKVIRMSDFKGRKALIVTWSSW